MLLVPPSILRWAVTALAMVAGAILYVLQDSAAFVVEGVKHVAQVHGVLSWDMLSHFHAQASFACVCFCAGALAQCVLWWFGEGLFGGMLFAVRFWLRPLAPLAALLLRLVRAAGRLLPAI